MRLDILRHGLEVDIVNRAEASKPEDKRRILGSIAFPRADTAALSQLQNAQRFAEVNGGLKSHFALASWYGHLAQGRDLSEAARALRADGLRRMAPGHLPLFRSATEVELSFAGLPSFSDQHLHGLASHLPCKLESLHLDATGPSASELLAAVEHCCPGELYAADIAGRDAGAGSAATEAPCAALHRWRSAMRQGPGSGAGTCKAGRAAPFGGGWLAAGEGGSESTGSCAWSCGW